MACKKIPITTIISLKFISICFGMSFSFSIFAAPIPPANSWDSSKFESLVLILDSQGTSSIWCRGIMIAPDWVISSSGCIKNRQKDFPENLYIAVLSKDTGKKTKFYNVVRKESHPNARNLPWEGADIALLKLEKPITNLKILPIAPLSLPGDNILLEGQASVLGEKFFPYYKQSFEYEAIVSPKNKNESNCNQIMRSLENDQSDLICVHHYLKNDGFHLSHLNLIFQTFDDAGKPIKESEINGYNQLRHKFVSPFETLGGFIHGAPLIVNVYGKNYLYGVYSHIFINSSFPPPSKYDRLLWESALYTDLTPYAGWIENVIDNFK
ncbi:trypsin-like serine protease [Endozoicomonas sp. Mp262]|uniref:trypsin-like serine protease n=1 Tax=Endozoicomonas sp. Mp262 TaxID=2919499 RepID=UPI0021D88671